MGRPQSLVGAAAVAGAILCVTVGAASEPREPCIPPGTYSPALGGSGPRGAGGVEPAASEQGSAGIAPATPETEDVPATPVPCTAVGTVWPPDASSESLPAPPELAIVMSDFRPKDAQLYLDGRPIGGARAFNGKNGFLFLKPGEYRLEARLGGYRTVAFRIDAEAGCRFDIRQRMERLAGEPKERIRRSGGGMGVQRIYGPTQGHREEGAAPAGPDLGLRPDLSEGPAEGHRTAPRSASLRLRISPPTASVYLDGTFVATGEELDRLVGPLAIEAGHHLVEVWAPGYVRRQVEVVARPEETTELEVTLERGDGD